MTEPKLPDIVDRLRIVLASLEREGDMVIAQSDILWLDAAIAEIERLRAIAPPSADVEAAKREAIEQAAKVAEEYERKVTHFSAGVQKGLEGAARIIAARIRSLSPSQPAEETK